jgi:hypothetical protein
MQTRFIEIKMLSTGRQDLGGLFHKNKGPLGNEVINDTLTFFSIWVWMWLYGKLVGGSIPPRSSS